MDIKIQDLSVEELKTLARAAGTTYSYLYQIKRRIRSPSRRLAAKLEKASGGLLKYQDLVPKPHV